MREKKCFQQAKKTKKERKEKKKIPYVCMCVSLSWKSQSSCHHWIVYVIHAIFFNQNKNLSELILLNWIGMARIGHITNEIRLQYPKRRHFLISWTGEHVVRLKNFFFSSTHPTCIQTSTKGTNDTKRKLFIALCKIVSPSILWQHNHFKRFQHNTTERIRTKWFFEVQVYFR